MRAGWLLIPVLGLALAAGTVDAQQEYPARPVRLIVPFPPGGPSDVVARLLAQKLAESFRQPVLVDNRPGAGGTLGAEAAVRAEPDGYTLIMVSAAYAANAALYKLPYDPVGDITPIVLVGEAGNLVVVHPSIPIKSVAELIAYDKANPGKLNYASGGAGGDTHLAAELFNQMAGTRLTHVPYKGTGPALNELLGGQVQLMFGNMSAMIPHLKTSRLRGIAVTTARRSDAVADVPTVAETLPGYEAATWAAVLGPKALPQGIVARWNAEIDRTLQLPDVKERLAGSGMEPVGGSPDRLRAVLERDVAKWRRVVETAGIKPGS